MLHLQVDRIPTDHAGSPCNTCIVGAPSNALTAPVIFPNVFWIIYPTECIELLMLLNSQTRSVTQHALTCATTTGLASCTRLHTDSCGMIVVCMHASVMQADLRSHLAL